jgi:uncharacterized protein
MKEKLSLARARLAATAASGIGQDFPPGQDGTLAVLKRLGSVQIDTISVVERAHHHVLRSRNPDYGAEHIAALEAKPRRLIEYWSHAAAYLPIEDYRFCIPRMERIRVQGHEWYRADKRTTRRVLDRIRAEGPLRAQDFEGAKGGQGWWDWKPAKRALEYLFQAGDLVAVGRRGFQKVYDLAERALPPGLDLRPPTADDMAAFYLDRATLALGVFAEEDIAYMRKDGLEGIPGELATRVEEGRLVELRIADGEGARGAGSRASVDRIHYADPELLASDPGLPSCNPAPRTDGGKLVVLSPFDPLLIDRRRAKRLFGVAYQLECYLPARKREFGYFALPLLYLGPEGDATLVGRLDAKAERGRAALVAKRLSLDPPKVEGKSLSIAGFARVAAEALSGFAAFNRAEAIELERFESKNGRLERSLRAAVSRIT